MNRLLTGAVAGLGATIPMTVAMKLMHDQLPEGEQYPLPPRPIAMTVADKAGVDDELDETGRRGFTAVSHFAFGTASGALFGLVAPAAPLAAPAAGVAYGVALWAGSYLGWVPALGILPPATRHPPRRTALMVAAHVVWGVAAGLLFSRLAPRRR
jgi:hypothetical protein